MMQQLKPAKVDSECVVSCYVVGSIESNQQNIKAMARYLSRSFASKSAQKIVKQYDKGWYENL